MSNSESNKVLRVLTGQRLKFTVRILKKDGSELEFQCNRVPVVDYSHEARSVMLQGFATKDEYENKYPIMPYDQVELMTCELNPEAEVAP